MVKGCWEKCVLEYDFFNVLFYGIMEVIIYLRKKILSFLSKICKYFENGKTLMKIFFIADRLQFDLYSP